MRLLELEPRLQALADLVPQGGSFADIGTDHAFLPVWLTYSGRIPCAIAADLREEPLRTAARTVKRYHLEDRISLRLCDGLNGIRPDEADTVVIAGMGGDTIIHILSEAPWTRDGRHLLLLQPMSSVPELRAWLQESGFAILREEIVWEGGRRYPILSVRAGIMEPLTPGELLAGRQSVQVKGPRHGEYLEHLCRINRTALDGLRLSRKPGDAERAAKLEIALNELEQMKERFDHADS